MKGHVNHHTIIFSNTDETLWQLTTEQPEAVDEADFLHWRPTEAMRSNITTAVQRLLLELGPDELAVVQSDVTTHLRRWGSAIPSDLLPDVEQGTATAKGGGGTSSTGPEGDAAGTKE